MARKQTGSPAALLEQLAQQALGVARKSRRHRQKLNSDNFYANKLAELRADAINAFNDLSSQSVGDVSAMAEMIEAVFSPDNDVRQKVISQRELIVSLRTTWRSPKKSDEVAGQHNLFPPVLLARANRGYLTTIGRQVNACFADGWYDACSVMMRRLLEIVIIEAFEHKQVAQKIKDKDGNYLHLSNLIGRAQAEQSWTLCRTTKNDLPKLRKLGDLSAHGRNFTAQKDDIERVRDSWRVAIEEFLRHASLL